MAVEEECCQSGEAPNYPACYGRIEQTRCLQRIWGRVSRRDDAEAYSTGEVDLRELVSTMVGTSS